jgi:hypothetical protein
MKLDAAPLLDIRLLDCVHVYFELRDLLCVGAVSLHHKYRRPEKNERNSGGDCVTGRILILRPRRNRSVC